MKRLATVTAQLDYFLPYFPLWVREVLVKSGSACNHLMKFSQTHYNQGLDTMTLRAILHDETNQTDSQYSSESY
jgi:hypothetical protein